MRSAGERLWCRIHPRGWLGSRPEFGAICELCAGARMTLVVEQSDGAGLAAPSAHRPLPCPGVRLNGRAVNGKQICLGTGLGETSSLTVTLCPGISDKQSHRVTCLQQWFQWALQASETTKPHKPSSPSLFKTATSPFLSCSSPLKLFLITC